MINYIQCKLAKTDNDTDSYYTTFLPERYARKNAILKLKNNNKWEDGWKVIEVYEDSIINKIPDFNASVRQHRKRTGDSLKK